MSLREPFSRVRHPCIQSRPMTGISPATSWSGNSCREENCWMLFGWVDPFGSQRSRSIDL